MTLLLILEEMNFDDTFMCACTCVFWNVLELLVLRSLIFCEMEKIDSRI